MIHTLDHLLLLGRPAAGKSEFIDFMNKVTDAERAEMFHIGAFEVLDDFHWLWEKFIEDDYWEEAGYERRYSERMGDNYTVRPDRVELYDFIMSKLSHAVLNNYLSRPEFYHNGTLIIEFSRGEGRGYQNALNRLSKEILKRAVILYVKVDFEEAWRKNVARYQEKLKSSSLYHMTPRAIMERLYKTDDWDEFTNKKESGVLSIQGVAVPFFTMNNEPELKEHGPLVARYRPCLNRLMELRKK